MDATCKMNGNIPVYVADAMREDVRPQLREAHSNVTLLLSVLLQMYVLIETKVKCDSRG